MSIRRAGVSKFAVGLKRTGYFEDLVNGKARKARETVEGEGEGGGFRRDPQVAATWLTNNLFGLLKDRLGREEEDEEREGGNGQGGGDGEGELER